MASFYVLGCCILYVLLITVFTLTIVLSIYSVVRFIIFMSPRCFSGFILPVPRCKAWDWRNPGGVWVIVMFGFKVSVSFHTTLMLLISKFAPVSGGSPTSRDVEYLQAMSFAPDQGLSPYLSLPPVSYSWAHSARFPYRDLDLCIPWGKRTITSGTLWSSWSSPPTLIFYPHSYLPFLWLSSLHQLISPY